MAWLAQEFTEKIKFSSGTQYYAVLSRHAVANIFYELNKFERGFSQTVKLRIPQFNFPTTCSVCPKTERTLHSLLLGHPLFFLHLASSDRPKFLEISNKKKCNYVVEPFFTWNNSFNLKNEHSNSIEKNRNKDMNIFYSILCILLIQICECLTFNVVLGYRGLLFRDFLWLFFLAFFF